MVQDNDDIREGKIYAILGYIGILCIIPLLLKKENKFAFYHGRQGLVLFIIEVAAFVVSMTPILGGILLKIIFFICGLFSLWGLIQSLLGNYGRLFLVSDIAEKITL
jgi:uncharacterized membrane protein